MNIYFYFSSHSYIFMIACMDVNRMHAYPFLLYGADMEAMFGCLYNNSENVLNEL